jgi:hypothetical protein
MPTTPSGRTAAMLRAEGYTVAFCERRLPGCFTSVDLYGCFDLVAVRADLTGVSGYQATSASNHAARVRKLLASAELAVWLAAGNRAFVVSWAKRQGRWAARSQELRVEGLAALPTSPATTPAGPNRKRPPTKYL